MADCAFCDIAAGRVRPHLVFEDDSFMAFLDINPLTCGHTIIIPKKHCATVFDIPPEELAKATELARKLALAAREALSADGVNILHASGEAAQQSVGHFHLHIVPRFSDDGVDAFPSRRERYRETDYAGVAAELSSALRRRRL
jgi:histidine triad (HIT) family protein